MNNQIVTSVGKDMLVAASNYEGPVTKATCGRNVRLSFRPSRWTPARRVVETPVVAPAPVEESVPWFATKVPGPHKTSQAHHFHTKSATACRRLNEAFARRNLCGQNVPDQEISRLKQALMDAHREDAAN